MEGTRVLVTTEFRGVFFGTLVSLDRDKRIVTLEDARNCVYWNAKCKGFLGLASVGPLPGSRVGPQVASVELFAVTSITPVSEEAEKVWGNESWN